MVKIRDLPPALLETAKKELHEDPDRRAADLEHMRDWLKKQPHIRADPDDQTLISFLRGCKFSLERTKEKLDTYYTMRTALPEFFKDRSMKDKKTRELIKLGLYLPLPGLDDKGRRVFMIRPGVTDPNKHKIEDQFKVNFMMMEMMIREDDDMLVNGMVNMLDLSKVTLAHGAMMTPSVVKKVMVCSQDGYPIRPKSINYIYTPPLFDTIFNLFKTFAKDKIKKRLFVHGDDLEALYKHIPQHLLPAEYGGKAGPIKDIIDDYVKKMDSYQDWFEKDAKSGVDESKRPGKPKTQQDLFGLEGSFRQLSVD